MADLKISQLPNASTPLAGTEVLPIVQAGVTDKVTVDNLLARLTAAPPAIGTTTPAAGSFTTLAASGNVTLGDAATDTLNVGNGGIIKDAGGNVGIGVAPAGSFNLAFPIGTNWYVGKHATTPHSAGNATRLDFGISDGSAVTGLSVRNTHDGTYSSQETFISTSYGGLRATGDIFKVDKSGNAMVIAPYGGLGYGTGAGGTVTQSTNKGTTVALNKPTGQITMHNSALGSGASAAFVVNNSLVTTSDTVIVSASYSTVDPSNYRTELVWVGNGSFVIRVTNISGGSLSNALVINFAIIKGATA